MGHLTNAYGSPDADELDGQNSSAFATSSAFGAKEVISTRGPLPLEGTYTSKGGTLIIWASGSGYRRGYVGPMGMDVKVDGASYGAAEGYSDVSGHKAFVDRYVVVAGLPAGQHTIRLEEMDDPACGTANETPQMYCTTTDNNDHFNVTVMEIPA